MKQALLIVAILSLSALALAGPAFDKNQIEANKAYQQTDGKQTEATQILEKWCYSSQMSQPEMTASFKRLVNAVKSSPEDKSTEAAVMSERICRGAIVPKSNSIENTNTDANAHELIKDVYMDALISCDSRECNKQLMNIIESEQVDSIRASYYMTRIAVSETNGNDQEAMQLAESFINDSPNKQTSEAVARQKLFAATAQLGKSIEEKYKHNQDSTELKQLANQVAKTIIERYVKPVSQQEVQQYQQQHPQQQSSQQSKKIAERSAALKALTNIPGSVLAKNQEAEQTLIEIAQNKQEMSTARQSAIECLEFNDSQQSTKTLKQLTFDQQEPIEVRVAAYRTLMTTTYAGQKDASAKQQMASEIIDEVVKHCEEQRNQQQDDQFVMYAISHLDNLRTSQQPEHQAIKECIAKNKQHSMQIHLLSKKLSQSADIRKSSRNYKLGQEFNKLESGVIVEGDIIYESKHNQQQYNKIQVLPKVVRVNMSMPVMGETVNVMEITLRQDQMDEELLGALKLVQATKFNSESVSKVVDSFKAAAEQRSGSNKQQNAEADLTIKVDGCAVVYICADDFKTGSQHQRKTRSVNSLVDEIIEQLKRKPVAFNRGFNFNVNERLAKVLDIEANVIAGLRFESRASGQSGKDFEIAAQIEPRFAFEAIVGPAKMSSKKLLQRVSTKTAIGVRLHYKSDELVDVQIDLPTNTMDLFTVETQMVEKSGNSNLPYTSYTYLPESIHGQEDIYSTSYDSIYGDEYDQDYSSSNYNSAARKSSLSLSSARKIKRSASFFEKKSSASQAVAKLMQGKQFTYSLETSEKVARSTGLRGKLRVVASPKDMSLLVQAIAQKYEAGMQGYRCQVQKQQRGSEQQQWIVTVSTPGSRVERTMQIRLVEQSSSQRTIVKADVQTPKKGYTVQYELVHDGRQYAVKTEIASTKSGQWRHSAELGVQRGSQSQSGRIATTYKPYVSIDSTSLKRPVQMQGVISYQQSPKSVISYELKCPTTGDYVQGKFILDERSSKASYGIGGKRTGNVRRSMRSPIESLLQNDYTLTGELVGQVSEYTIKAHKMIDWDSAKQAIQAELQATRKSQRKSVELSASLKLDKDQQVLTVQRKCPQQERMDYRLTIASDCKSSNGHQLVAECRYNGPRNSIVAYKHKVDYTQLSSKKAQIGCAVEIVASERQLNEKFAGRAQLGWERKMKTLKGEMSGHGKSAKVDLEYASLGQHQIDVVFQGERWTQRTSVRADQHQFQMQSRTDNKNQLVAKANLNVQKQQDEAQLSVEIPAEGVHCAVDLKLGSGKLSSVAVQTPRFASKAEFVFDKSSASKSSWRKAIFPGSSLRFKTDLKDLAKKESYWMESALNGDLDNKSYFRYNSPIHHTDLEYDPRTQQTKFGAFARSKRSINDQLYSNEDSLLNQLDNKLNLGSKLWMMRSIVSSPSNMDQLSKKAVQALFEYADRRQNHRHSINYDPSEERVKFNFDRQPSTDYSSGSSAFNSPMRLSGDFASSPRTWFTNSNQMQQRPSSLNMESEYVDFDLTAKPFDGQESFARFNALSRHPRSAFKKHESEIRYKKDQGYKAWMKHQDAQDRRHSFQAEADQSPKKWAKMTYESDKHGKAQWDHKWRQHATKRSESDDEANYYQNKFELSYERPSDKFAHHSQLHWVEPTPDYLYKQHSANYRERRDTASELAELSSEAQRRYNTVDYLKHLNAKFNSETSRNNAKLYKVDFDFAPKSHARLNVDMPEDWLHASSIEYEPTERLYKMQSKLYNSRTKQPSYELYASTKPYVVPAGLATADQEPLFIESQHSMLDYPLTNTWTSGLFKQPLKLDYSDKYGRVARFDYDQSPILDATKYAGLRQKRAALFYKDSEADFEHQSDYDFYPEAVFGLKPSKRVPGDFSVKAQTKYGPIVVHTDASAEGAIQMQLQSPVFNAKITAERSSAMKRGGKLIKLTIDNQQQTVQLAKIVRKTAGLKECQLVEQIARKIDQGRFEHQSELLVNHDETISKIKSQTYMNKRPVLIVEGELNEQQDKLIVKINGERSDAQLLVDLASKSANLAVSKDNKRTLQHQTRLQRINEKFFALESMTYYKQQPLFKLTGKVSAMILSEPAHLFSRRRSGASSEEHISVFDAMLYEPKQMQITGQYDCLRKEARVIVKDQHSKTVQESTIKYDDQTETVFIDARLSSPYGQIYSSHAKLNLPGFINQYKCRSSQSCQSELVYSDRTHGAYSAKYLPGKYFSVNTPHGQQNVNLSVY